MRRFLGGKPRAIAHSTYHHFARKYGISLTSGGKKKSYAQLAQEIYNYENTTGKKRGLYFAPR